MPDKYLLLKQEPPVPNWEATEVGKAASRATGPVSVSVRSAAE